jgi:hypothetical protein
MEKAAADRYPSVLDFSRALREAVRATESHPSAPTSSVTEVLPTVADPVLVSAGATKVLPVVGAVSSPHPTTDSVTRPTRLRALPTGLMVAVLAAALVVALVFAVVRWTATSDDATTVKTMPPAERPSPAQVEPRPAQKAIAPPPAVVPPTPKVEAEEKPAPVITKPNQSGRTKAPPVKPGRPKAPLNESL